MCRRQSELPTWLQQQQQLRLRRLHGGNSQAVPPRPPAPALLLRSHPSFAASAPRGIDLFISLCLHPAAAALQEGVVQWLPRDVTSSTAGAGRDNRRWLPGDPRVTLPGCLVVEEGFPRGRNGSSKLPWGRGAEPSSGIKAQLSCTPFSGGRDRSPCSEGVQRSQWPNRLQKQVAMQGGHPRKHQPQSISRAWWELF